VVLKKAPEWDISGIKVQSVGKPFLFPRRCMTYLRYV